MRNKIKQLLPANILSLLKQVRYLLIIFLFRLFHLLPIRKRRIVLCNVWGFGDNAKYVAEELNRNQKELIEKAGDKARKKLPYEIIFITNHPSRAHAPQGIKVYKTNSPAAIFALATARVWVDNNRKESYIRKRKGQFYIQTWHGGIALKKIEKDYEEKLGVNYITNAKRDSAMTDLYVSNSNFCTNMYNKSLWYRGEILECGSPRNDILLNQREAVLQKVRQSLGIRPEERIVIYAPTYREGDNSTVFYDLNYTKLLDTLNRTFGGNWVAAVRLHPLVAEQSNFITYSNKVINASHYRDLYELMAAADILITDYSNVMFEFSLMHKPVFLYALDQAIYERERGFYFNYQELPYSKAVSQEELLQQIDTFQEKEYLERVEIFLQQLEIYEKGNASKKVAERIYRIMAEGK
jgi:CDP-glycerol glycerophosphotransferase